MNEPTQELRNSVVELDREVTQHKRAEVEPSHEKALLEAIFNGIPDAIVYADINRMVIAINPGFTSVFGYAIDDVVGKETAFFYADREEYENQGKQRFNLTATEQALPYEVNYRKKDGRIFVGETLGTVIKAANGEKIGFIGVIRDITERKQAESALRESERRFRDLYEKAPLAYQSLDVAGNILEVNEAWLKQLGRTTREEVIGRFIGDFMTEAAIVTLGMEFPQFKSKGSVDGPIFEFVGKDGSHCLLTVNGRIHRDSEGNFLRTHCILTDITERKQHEQALANSEARFRGLVEQSLTGVYMFVTETGKYLYTNPRMEQMFGYGPGELVGLGAEDIIVEEDLPIVFAARKKRLAGATSAAYEVRARRKDGSVFHLAVQGANYESQGTRATVGMAQDITERKRAEDEIKRYSVQLKTAFFSTVEMATVMGEMRDPYTAGHQRRVAGIAVAIGTELGFDEQRIEGLRVAGYLHDVGKITIPAEILVRPGKLGPIEFQFVKGHAQASYDILKNVKFPWPVAEIALQHHERMDGSGYPQGLKGEAILLKARILAVADVVEAMASHRPYRPGLGIDKALAEIERGRDILYDPVVADACLRLFREKGYTIPE